MAFIAGYVTREEFDILVDRGWDVEDGEPPDGFIAIAIFVDNDLFTIMSGRDWDKSSGQYSAGLSEAPVRTFTSASSKENT